MYKVVTKSSEHLKLSMMDKVLGSMVEFRTLGEEACGYNSFADCCVLEGDTLSLAQYLGNKNIMDHPRMKNC